MENFQLNDSSANHLETAPSSIAGYGLLDSDLKEKKAYGPTMQTVQ